MTYKYEVQQRDVAWWSQRYRIVRINEDGERQSIGKWFTLKGARRWVKATQWEKVPDEREEREG